MNPWDGLRPKDLEGWVPLDEQPLTEADLDWMRRQVEPFDTDRDPGDETDGS